MMKQDYYRRDAVLNGEKRIETAKRESNIYRHIFSARGRQIAPGRLSRAFSVSNTSALVTSRHTSRGRDNDHPDLGWLGRVYCTYAGRWSSVNDQAPSSSTPTIDDTPGSSIVTP
jgi:hypothetical protein